MAEPPTNDQQSEESPSRMVMDPPGTNLADGEEDQDEEMDQEEEAAEGEGDDNNTEEKKSPAVKIENAESKSPREEGNAKDASGEENNENDEGEEEEDEEEEDDDEDDEGDTESKQPLLGGDIGRKAFCLLDGIFEKEDDQRRVTIPLTRLPAVLGRSHATGDRNFFPLGPSKALSRQHAIVSFRDATGGSLVTPKNAAKDSEEEDKLEYEKPSSSNASSSEEKPFAVVNLQDESEPKDGDSKENSPPPSKMAATFPPRGAYVLEALGKNLIMVGNKRIRSGEFAILKPGVPVRMSAFSFYFLLPSDITEPPKTMDIPLQEEKSTPPKNAGTKRKLQPSPKDMPQPKLRKPKAAPFAQLQAELDELPIETLLERMTEACKAPKWERKHQLIGSTISYHAVQDAAKDQAIRKMAANGGVPRTEFMKWIKASPKYSKWVDQMMSKMEAKSYQNTITKALLKAGNERTGTGGRYIKWILPDVPHNPSGSNTGEEGKSSSGDKKSDDKDGGGDEEEEEEEGEEDGDGEDDENDNEGSENNQEDDDDEGGGSEAGEKEDEDGEKSVE